MQFLKNIRLRLTDSTKYVKLFSENLCGKQMKQKAETFLRILGIDPGLATMGWGVIEADGYREKLVQYGALITYPRDTFSRVCGAFTPACRGSCRPSSRTKLRLRNCFSPKT